MIRIGIVGYGNIGMTVEKCLSIMEDMKLEAIFSRRSESIKKDNVYHINEITNWKDAIDVLILCGGSVDDLLVQTPELVQHFHVVDSFDMHNCMEKHWQNVQKNALLGKHLACIGAGWDPGFFSLFRLYGEELLHTKVSTFWGKGVSQGHSKAIRTIQGVKDARAYTIPKEEDILKARKGESSCSNSHSRECFVVADEGANIMEIKQAIVSMPYYFAPYKTTVHFIDDEMMQKEHNHLYHEGHVIGFSQMGIHKNEEVLMELHVQMTSNPHFTAMILCACARAIYRMSKEHQIGCITMMDIAPSYYCQSNTSILCMGLL